VSISPFDDDHGSVCVLAKDDVSRGLGLAFADGGCRVLYGEANRAACLDYIEQHRTDIRPRSLRERLAQRRALDR
jgi:uncharacterized protein YbdZ (MbtH family)